ncbi:MerR family transcriptional regulator [Lentilactobacillus senioris]|uniref:MerR family transcriptional regulator n=1 Tax=Lentilactobacillus senioris TaxID=931534 RepID=UPI003D2DB1AB
MESDKHYKIGEFAQLVGLSTYTLRYYENEGLIVSQRDTNGVRYYTDQDVKWLGFLLHLKGTGMKITDLKTYVRLRAQGDSTIAERSQLLERVKRESEAEIRERQNSLAVLSKKIDWYDGKLDQSIDKDETFEEYLKRFE